MAAAVWASDPDGRELVHEAAQAARAAPTESPEPSNGRHVPGCARAPDDGWLRGRRAGADRALAAVHDLDLGADDVDSLVWLAGNRVAGIIALEAWDFDAGFALAQQQASVARESGALVQLQFVLNFLANNVVLTGDLRRASALIEEERRLSIMTGVPPLGYSGLLVEAFRGEPARRCR